ncbi:sialidase-3 [Pleuronectes platessa]|uniref:sialidase-3 n=1 Tax=Pleuronectes platessa TaxID=8262 RepID=UPI00232A5EBA|nr:sialidase-3 [Pleuronectes platessa]
MVNIILKDNKPQKQPVFDSQEEGCVYRIPALCYNSCSQTLFAFAEKRTSLSDDDAEMLVMKTGKLKEDDSNEIQWSEQKEVKNALLSGHRTMNPCPVYEKKSNKLFLFFICVKNGCSEQSQITDCSNKAHLCYITTADDGENWSELKDLTPDLHEIDDWATFAVGPGHGLQTQKDRLIVPVYAYKIKKRKKRGSCCCRKVCAPISYALALYTDDPDKGWKFGNMLETESGECQMAEFLDDKGNWVVYCNARSKSGHRVEAVSLNEGDDFSILTGKLVDTKNTGCQGSVVSFPAQSEVGSTKTWLLFSHTTDVKKRVDLGVYLNKSPQDPDKWSEPWKINIGISGYSDLAYIGNGRFVCLMECGKEKTKEDETNKIKDPISDHIISSVMFSYDQVEQGIRQ